MFFVVVAVGRFLRNSGFTLLTNIRLLRANGNCTGTHVRVGPRRLGNNNMYRNNTVFALTSLTFTTTAGDRTHLALSVASDVGFFGTRDGKFLCTRTHRTFDRGQLTGYRIQVAGRANSLVTAFGKANCEGSARLPFTPVR